MKLPTEKAPLIALAAAGRPAVEGSTGHEFVNPGTGEDVAGRLRTDDPFDIYSSPGEARASLDPFDTSRALNPFAFPNPLFRTDQPTHKSPASSPPLSVDSSSALAKVKFFHPCDVCFFLFNHIRVHVARSVYLIFLFFFLICYCYSLAFDHLGICKS